MLTAISEKEATNQSDVASGVESAIYVQHAGLLSRGKQVSADAAAPTVSRSVDLPPVFACLSRSYLALSCFPLVRVVLLSLIEGKLIFSQVAL